MFHNEDSGEVGEIWQSGRGTRTKESLCNITSDGTKGNTSSSPKKANSTSDGTCSYFTMKIYELTVAFFSSDAVWCGAAHYHISGPTRQWIECASNFPAVRPESSRVTLTSTESSTPALGVAENFGRMRRKVAGSWQTSNTKKDFEGCSKNSRLPNKMQTSVPSLSHAALVYPSLSLGIAFHGWSLLTWNLSSFTLIVVI